MPLWKSVEAQERRLIERMQTLQREEDLLTSSQSKGIGLPGSDGNSAMVKSCWHLLYVCFLGVGNGLE